MSRGYCWRLAVSQWEGFVRGRGCQDGWSLERGVEVYVRKVNGVFVSYPFCFVIDRFRFVFLALTSLARQKPVPNPIQAVKSTTRKTIPFRGTLSLSLLATGS
jgi:hypothetical protein